MSWNKLLLLTLIIANLIGCKREEFDAGYFAKEYCNCLQNQRNLGKDFFDARTMCDGEMLTRNRFFRIDYIDLTYRRYLMLLPQKLGDSVADFHSRFYKYLEKNCCKIALDGCDKSDSLQIRLYRPEIFRK